jgi:nickel-dependent lactate racemase
MMKTLYVYHGGAKHAFALPIGWRLLAFAANDDAPALADVSAAVRKALAEPTATPPLAEMCSAAKRVAVLVEDLTRTSPKRVLLEEVLKCVDGAGVPRERVSVVIALGTHRPLSDQELISAFGRGIVSSYRFYNHDCQSPDLIPVGQLANGVPVKIHPIVAAADLKIGIGSIFPHPMNGFGGGGKVLFPGVADLASIQDHHFRLTFHPGTELGRTEGNRFREEVYPVVSQVGLGFIVNSVMNPEDRACGVVAGNPAAAHEAGIEQCRVALTRTFPGRSDVTVITSFPYSEGPQIVKPLIPASFITRPGGVVLWLVDCATGLPDLFLDTFERFHQEYGSDLRRGVLSYFEDGRLLMEGGAIDFNLALGVTLAIQTDLHIVMVTRDLTRRHAEKMGMDYAADLEEAFRLAERIVSRPSVHIVPAGGTMLPRLEK